MLTFILNVVGVSIGIAIARTVENRFKNRRTQAKRKANRTSKQKVAHRVDRVVSYADERAFARKVRGIVNREPEWTPQEIMDHAG